MTRPGATAKADDPPRGCRTARYAATRVKPGSGYHSPHHDQEGNEIHLISVISESGDADLSARRD